MQDRHARRGTGQQHREIVHHMLPGRNPGSMYVSAWAVVKAAGDQR
jgi:hypothetical protein